MKEFSKSVNSCGSYCKKFDITFFETQCIYVCVWYAGRCSEVGSCGRWELVWRPLWRPTRHLSSKLRRNTRRSRQLNDDAHDFTLCHADARSSVCLSVCLSHYYLDRICQQILTDRQKEENHSKVKSKQMNLYIIRLCHWSAQVWPVCNNGITQFYLPLTHEPYLP